MNIAAVLLAAGRSRRFGPDDKLKATFGGRTLLQHATGALRGVNVTQRYIVCSDFVSGCEDFVPVRNAYPETGLGRSIALGVAAAKRGGASAVLLALADMPFVSAAHYGRLVMRYEGGKTLAASSDGSTVMPPALFGSDWFEALQGIAGDVGARTLVRQAAVVEAGADELLDVDCLDDLDRARLLILQPAISPAVPGQPLHKSERRA